MQRRLSLVAVLCILPLCTLRASARAQSPATFTISGSRILKNGSEFLIHGVNVNGPGWQWSRKTVQDLDAIVKIWKFNLIRVNCSLKPRPNGKEPNDLDEIIQAFTARGVVVLIDAHDHPGGYYQDPPVPAGSPSLTDLINWDKALAARYKNNPYVWFEVMSGPGSRQEKTTLDLWQQTHERVIQALRQEASAPNIIVCEGADQGCEDGNNGTFAVPDAASAILTFGPDLSRRYANLLYAIHVDANWTGGGAEKFADYVDRVHARDLPILVTEYGHSDYRDSTPAIEAMMDVCKSRHIGRCAWHWFSTDYRLCAPDDKGGGWQIDTMDGSRPTNLSWLGDKVWDDNHGLVPLHGPPLDRSGWTATAFSAPTNHYNQPDEALSPYTIQDDYWTSDRSQEPGQWFQVDMGIRRTFARILIDTRARFTDYPRGYEIAVSNDGMRWSAPIAKGTNDQSVLRISFPVQTARFIKVVQTGKSGRRWTLADFQVYAPVGTFLPVPAPRLVARESVLEPHGWLATSDPRIWNCQVPLHPLKNENEYAATGQAQQPGQFYQVDMGDPLRFDKIVLSCGRSVTDYPRGYEVYVSGDGTDWGKPIASGRGAPITTIVFPTQTARYIRVVQTRYNHDYWAIAQFRIYGP